MSLVAVVGDTVSTKVNKAHQCEAITICATTPNITVTVGGEFAVVQGGTTGVHTFYSGDSCKPHIAELNPIISTVMIGGLPVSTVGDTFMAPCGGQIVGGLNATVFAN